MNICRTSAAITLTLIFGFFVAPALHAAEKPDSSRPRIGLVLGGGGAKGGSHVGVLKVLEALHIPIDVIAGTSMGAIVGGLYATGMTAQEIEREMAAIDWANVFNDSPPRPQRPLRRKQDDEVYLVKNKPGFSDGKLKLPLGVIQGQNFALHLARLTLPASDIGDFDELPIPFRAVATDIETGDKVVLGEGDLERAIHASMAVPGAFAPVKIGDRLLVDGGLSDQLPIDVAREMGADIVIAVDLTVTLAKSDELKSVLSMLNQLSALLTYRNVQRQIDTLSDKDIYLKPDLHDVGSTDFDKLAEAIGYGFDVAIQARETLSTYSLSPPQYAAHVGARKRRGDAPQTIEFIRFVNDSRLSDTVLAARMGLAVGMPFDVAAIETGIANLYGLDVFESVRYRVIHEREKLGIEITAVEKSWGPKYLQFGIALSDDLDGDNAWDIGASYLVTNLNSLGGEARFAIQLGERPAAFAELYQPLDAHSRWFIRPRLAFLSRSVGRFDNGDQVDEFRVRRVGASIAAGYLFENDAEVALGFRRFIGEAEHRIGKPREPDFSFNVAELFLRLSYDTLDNANFPREGIYFRGEWRDTVEDLGGDGNASQFASNFLVAKSFGRHTVMAAFEFDVTLHGVAQLQNRFLVGGFTDLSGFAQDELSGQQVAIARAIYYQKIDWIKWVPAYIGGSIEYGNAFEDRGDISFDPRDAMIAGSIFVGFDSVVGPLYVSYGHAERGNDSIYLFLGRIF